MREIKPFFVMEILARAKELERSGRDIIHLEIGEPDFPTPPLVTQAAMEFLSRGMVTYTPAAGIPELRSALAAYYLNRHGVSVSPARIFVTPGASGAFLLTLAMTVIPGQRVLITDPGYPCYANLVRFLGGDVTLVPVGSQTNFHLTPELVAQHWEYHTAGGIIASPSNPTGTVIGPEILAGLVRQFESGRGFFISDEIYHGLEYSGLSPTALEFSQDVIVVNSFSKYFGMTGWRVGWAIVPDRLTEQAERLAQNLFISASAPGQYAALAALSPACRTELERRRHVFAERRDFLARELIGLGFKLPARPDGAFYIYADCSAFTQDSSDFARRLLEDAGVAITPGKDFGKHCPEKFVRIAYTASASRLSEAVARLRDFLATY